MGLEFVFVCWLFGCLGWVLCLLSKTTPLRVGFYNIYQTPNVYPRVITLALIPTLPYRERAYFFARQVKIAEGRKENWMGITS